MKQLTQNFHRSEFDCKDGTVVPNKYKINLIELAVNLQVIRAEIGQKIIINSGYRTTSHNRKVGGSSNSQHLTAKAADLVQNKESPLNFYRRIEKLIQEGKVKQGGLGLYDWGVHYDIRGHKARWNNSTLY